MRGVVLAILMGLTGLAGCLQGEAPDLTPPASTGEPGPYTLPETITGLDHLTQAEWTLPDGATVDDVFVDGIWLRGNVLYTSGENLGVFDITNPAQPRLLSFVEETRSRDVDILEHPNGRLYAVLAGSPGVILVDVTDPAAASVVSKVTVGFHNIAVVPGTALVYNSRSLYPEPELLTEGGLVDIIDFTDPAHPRVSEFRFPRFILDPAGVPRPVTAPACHDIAVYPEADRAYCAGVTETQVWDISDPTRPEILQVVHNPATNIHHAAYAARNHTILILGDELGGAAGPGCTLPDQVYGGVWFFDISNLATPTPLGWWAPAEPIPAAVPCTAHFGNLIEDRDLLVIGFYQARTTIIDFSDPTDPTEAVNFRPGGSAWDSRYHRGYIYTGDTRRGVDVLQPTGPGLVAYE